MAKRKRHLAEQMSAILRQQEVGLKVSDICRKHAINEQTFFRWKSKYGGMGASEVKWLKALEEENRRLKQIVADKELDIQALKSIVEGKY